MNRKKPHESLLQLRPASTSSAVSKRQVYTANTIDEKHTEMLQSFHRIDQETIPNLKTDIQEYKLLLKKYALNKNLEEYLEILDKIEATKKQIKSLRTKEKHYLLENSKYIFQYFEQKKDISEGGGSQNVNVLNQYFKIKRHHQRFFQFVQCKISGGTKHVSKLLEKCQQ